MRAYNNYPRIVATLLIWVGGGCASHLHNDQDMTLAQSAQRSLADLSKAHRSVFASMVTNLDTMSAFETKAYDEMAKRLSEVEARIVTRMTWSKLREQLAESGILVNLSDDANSIAAHINQELVDEKLL